MNLFVGRPPPQFESKRRSGQKELLDEAIDKQELANVLQDLARFNGAMMGHWPILRWLDAAMRDIAPGRALTVLDIGCGFGDLLRAIRHWGQLHGRTLTLIGIDLNPDVILIARNATAASDEIEYRAADAFEFQFDAPIDIILSSLLTHHLPDAMIVRFLRRIDATARRGWLIYDLQRNRIPFYFIALAGLAMRLHPVVTYDGRISVARALTRKEWQQRIIDASISLESVHIRWFMFRYVIGRMK